MTKKEELIAAYTTFKVVKRGTAQTWYNRSLKRLGLAMALRTEQLCLDFQVALRAYNVARLCGV